MSTLPTRWNITASHRDAAPRNADNDVLPALDVADELAIDVDADGSPVTMPEAEWLLCFVPGLRRQWWHRFAHPTHKHVFAIRKLENDTWLLVEPWWTRLMVNVLTFDQAVKFLRWGAAGHILKVRESIPGHGNQMRGWSNCAVLMAFLLGRSYWTWTPDGLYRRLLADADVQAIDLAPWLDDHFQSLARKVVDAVSNVPQRGVGQSLHDALLAQGVGLMTAMTSASANELHNAASSEASAFRKSADACWRFVTQQAIGRLLPVLEDAWLRGEVDIDDGEFSARQFVAMLLAGAQPQSATTLRPVTDAVGVRLHAATVVAMFLADAASTASRSPVVATGQAARVSDLPPRAALACR